MIVEVEMNAFADGAIREVDIPVDEIGDGRGESVLDLAFKYGQNEFQNKPLPSVSVGDVIRYEGKRYEVSFIGFKELV
jgi:hypothetical protein